MILHNYQSKMPMRDIITLYKYTYIERDMLNDAENILYLLLQVYILFHLLKDLRFIFICNFLLIWFTWRCFLESDFYFRLFVCLFSN